MDISVIAFDLFGTVFKMDNVSREEIQAYGRHISMPYWSPLTLPDSWEELFAFEDSQEGIDRLRRKYTVVTLSNAPLKTQINLLRNRNIRFDGIIPLEIAQVYKPRQQAYRHLAETLRVPVEKCLMVSANKDFGDIENAKAVGMNSQLIRNAATPLTITRLAALLDA